MNRPALKEIEELEAFGATATFPDVLLINAAITQYNSKKYFEENIRLLKSGDLMPIIAQQRLDRLKEIRTAVERLTT